VQAPFPVAPLDGHVSFLPLETRLLARVHRLFARDRYERLELNALVQRVIVTDARRKAAEELTLRWTQLNVEEILQSPYVLVGTVDQLIDDLQGRRTRWGISYFLTHEPYVDAFAPVVARLAGT